MSHKQEEIKPQGAPVPGSEAEKEAVEGNEISTQPMGEERDPI